MVKRLLILIFSAFILTQTSCETPTDLALSAHELYTSFTSNIHIGRELYVGQQIEVSGSLAEYYPKSKNKVVLYLRKKDQLYGVKCIVDNASSQIQVPLRLTQEIKVKGKCQGLNEDVLLDQCEIISKKTD